MYSDNLMAMIGKDVEVEAGGMLYQGRLVEVSDSEVFLQGTMGWIQIAVETVTRVKLKV